MLTFISFAASAHTGEHIVDEYPDISGITTARVRKTTARSINVNARVRALTS